MRPHVEGPDYERMAESRQIGREAHEDRKEIKRLRDALLRITGLECTAFVYPADWSEQIAACSECQRYKSHPIQQGICDLHRKPIYARERHDDHEQRTLIYRAQDIARAALVSK